MEKLLQSRKFVFGVLSLIASIFSVLWPETRAHLDTILPAIGLLYLVLVSGTTAEDAVKVWAENRPANAGAALQDVLDAIAELSKAPAPSPNSATSTTTWTTTGDMVQPQPQPPQPAIVIEATVEDGNG